MFTRRFLHAVAAAGLLALFASCQKKLSDEAQIQQLLKDGVAALEAGDLSAAADLLDDAYLDARKRDKRQMKILALFATRQGRIMLFLRDTQITITGANATVHTTAYGLLGAGNIAKVGDLIPKKARQAKLTLSLHKSEDKWRVTAIDGDGLSQGG